MPAAHTSSLAVFVLCTLYNIIYYYEFSKVSTSNVNDENIILK